MKTSEALKIIYDEAAKKLGKDKARKYLTAFFSNLVFDLEEGHALEAETIEKKIIEEAAFIQKINNNKDAA